MADGIHETELLWRDYALNADLYKFYLEITMKANVFFYAVTGGILSFSLQKPEIGFTKAALVLPILMSIGLAVVFFRSIPWAIELRDDNYDVAKRLGLQKPNEFSPLIFVLIVFGILKSLCAVGLAIFLWLA